MARTTSAPVLGPTLHAASTNPRQLINRSARSQDHYLLCSPSEARLVEGGKDPMKYFDRFAIAGRIYFAAFVLIAALAGATSAAWVQLNEVVELADRISDNR